MMKKQNILSMIQLLLVPGLLTLLGLILVINPDTASALISRLLGYALILGAVCTGLAAVFIKSGQISRGIASVTLAIVGGWLVAHPLWLAAWISRFLGIIIVINVLPDLWYALKQKRNCLFHILAAAVGVTLILLPLTASRLVFTLCGIAVLAIGGLMFLDRIRGRRWLKEASDPNIIDAL